MEIIFNYTGVDVSSYQCNDTKETLNSLFHQCKSDVDINTIVFLYNGIPTDGNISINKIINNTDLQRNKMNILIIEKEEEENPVWIKSKDIICPKCGECAKLDINEYKILIQCKNKHNLGNILLNEYEDTQKIDISKIKCDECKKETKAKSYNNNFYRCNQCNKNLCPYCKSNHDKSHCIKEYDKKDSVCLNQYESYNSYCRQYHLNLCLKCEKAHSMHEYILME